MKVESDDMVLFGLGGIILFFLLSFYIFKNINEAATFNKFKSKETPEATFWDAVFIELRVEAQ